MWIATRRTDQLAPGSNALGVAEAVKQRMDELQASFPQGVTWGEGQTAYVAIGIAASSDEHLGLLPKRAKPDMEFFQSRTLLLHEVDWPMFGKE